MIANILNRIPEKGNAHSFLRSIQETTRKVRKMVVIQTPLAMAQLVDLASPRLITKNQIPIIE